MHALARGESALIDCTAYVSEVHALARGESAQEAVSTRLNTQAPLVRIFTDASADAMITDSASAPRVRNHPRVKQN